MTAKMRTNNLLSIQYLRGIAAISVVYFHTKLYLQDAEWHLDRSFGYGGVDLFFVISGFIMMHTTFDNDKSPWLFMLKRAARVYPIYWIAASLAFAIYLFIPTFFQGATVDRYLVIFSYLLLPIQNGDASSMGVPFLSIAWTLVLEMYFYGAFTLVLFSKNPNIRLGLMACIIGGMALYGALNNLTSSVLLFYTNVLTLEFVFGMFVAWTIRTFQFEMPTWLLVILLAGVFLPLFAVGGGRGDGLARVASFGLPAAGIVLCLALLEMRGAFRKSVPWLKVLGDASYSIYLFHPFALSAIKLAVKMFHLPTSGVMVGAFLVIGGVISATVFGVVFYRFCEKPITRYLNDWVRRYSSPGIYA